MEPTSNTGPPQGPTPPAPETNTTLNIPPTITTAPEPISTPPATPAQPVVMVGGDFAPDPGPPIAVNDPAKPTVMSAPRRWKSKKVLIPLLAVLLVACGAAAYYFGYYMNPSMIYSQSLSNTGKGYDKLITYIDARSQLKNQAYTGNGDFSYKSESFSTDGTMAFKSSEDNAELKFDVGAGITRVNTEIRVIKSSGSTPDIYIKASGIKGLGAFAGSAELDTTVNKLDNTWIVVDHSLVDSLSGTAAESQKSGPTREEIMDEMKAFGRVNQDYIFTTDKDKAVTVVVKEHGTETVEGHKTYHFTVGLQKDNLKKYISAQREALKSSKLGAWIKKNKYDKQADESFDEATKSVDKIKPSDTFDMWMDVNKRIVYKVRFEEKKNPANNFVDIGLDYKGGDKYPFFLSGKSKNESSNSNGLMIATLDTKTGNMDLNINYQDEGKYGGTIKSKFSYKPTNEKIKIDKPANAKSLSEVLSDLGLGGLLQGSTTNPSGPGVPPGSLNSGIQGRATTPGPEWKALLKL